MPTEILTPSHEPTQLKLLEALHRKIERSSNFRFAWQFFKFSGVDGVSPYGAQRLLETVIALDECHQFLRDTFDPMYDPHFEIKPIHEHSAVTAAGGEFENVLAAAANDHLGAYSLHNRDSTPREAAKVSSVFESLGQYNSFQLIPGAHPGCEICGEHNNHVFSTWFYGVAWDWCFVLTWPRAHRAWVGCLTDTD